MFFKKEDGSYHTLLMPEVATRTRRTEFLESLPVGFARMTTRQNVIIGEPYETTPAPESTKTPYILDFSPPQQDNILYVKINLKDRIKNTFIENSYVAYKNLWRYEDQSFLNEIKEANPNFFESVEAGRYRRSITFNRENIQTHFISPIKVATSTEEYVSIYPKTLLDKFFPEDGAGFVELTLDEPISYTRDIQCDMITNNYFNSYGNSANRKYSSIYSSNITIDSFNNFSYLSDTLQDKVIAAIGPRKIKALEIDNFYRGSSPAKATLTEARHNKIVKGNYVFPIKLSVNVLNTETFTYETKKILVFALFRSYDRVIRYSKSREFIVELLEELTFADGLKFFDPELYQQKINELYGPHVEYWSGITSIWQGCWTNSIEPKTSTSEKVVTSIDMAPTFGYEAIKRSPETIAYQEIQKAYGDVNLRIRSNQNEISNNNRYIERENSDIANYKRHLEQLISSVERRKAEIQKLQLEAEAMQIAKESMQSDYNAAKQAYQTKISNVSADLGSATKWLNNLAKTGIVIEDILYRNIVNGSTKSIRVANSIHLLAMEEDSDWKLTSVSFRTTKPTIIYVDRGSRGDSCKKVVGGPYNIQVSENDIRISLQSSKSCFGYDDNRIWVHPHTNYLSVDPSRTWSSFTSSFVNVFTRGCLGEASPILYNAFKNNDVKSVIFGAMTWVSSANSTDTWGKNYKYFPKLSEVNVDGSPSSQNEEPETLELDENAITSLTESLALDIEEEYPDTYDQQVLITHPTVDTQPEYLETEEDEEPTQAPQEDTYNLRHAGIQGYRPYGA